MPPKTSAFKVEAFQAVPYGQLGTIAGGRVYFEAAISKCHTVNSVFAGKNYTSLPRADIIYTHCDDDGVLIEAAVNAVRRVLFMPAAVWAASTAVRRPHF